MEGTRRAGRGFNITDGNGHLLTFLPGDVVPDEVADLVTNPKIWVPEANGQDEENIVQSLAPGGPASREAEDEEEEQFDSSGETGVDLSGLTVKQLHQMAVDQGIDLQGVSKKAELIKVLQAHVTQ